MSIPIVDDMPLQFRLSAHMSCNERDKVALSCLVKWYNMFLATEPEKRKEESNEDQLAAFTDYVQVEDIKLYDYARRNYLLEMGLHLAQRKRSLNIAIKGKE